MGLRDRAKFTGNRNTGNSSFLDAPGLYEIEVTSLGGFTSQVDDTGYWKLGGFITERDTKAPEGQSGEYSPLAVESEVVVIHNLSKDKWGFSRGERVEIAAALGVSSEDWAEGVGRRIIVEIWPKTNQKGRTSYVRSWTGAGAAEQAPNPDLAMPF